MGTAAAALELEADSLINSTKYRLTLRLPPSSSAASGEAAALAARFVCRRVVVPRRLYGEDEGEWRPAYCDKCCCAPVAVAYTGTTCVGSPVLVFTVTPHCSSSRTHFGCDLIIVLRELCLATRPFRTLSRNCKYRARAKAGRQPPQLPQHAAVAPFGQNKALLVRPLLLEPSPLPFMSPPTLVDESAAWNLLRNTDQLSVLITGVHAVAARLLLPRAVPVVFLHFFENELPFTEFITRWLASRPPLVQAIPTCAPVDGQHSCVIGVVDRNELATFFLSSVSLARTTHIRDGHVRLTHALVF
eukprot:TRINITY_DN2167_c0_g1_i1.p1 TRINITY_DN2167_c0_g1~~TRINITY_DN2167_c0_g1_i1.p1  ORF type:complete len:302 (-),score=69.96 TRINITY_DN2167_c0_g1_i1:57-962(-)